MHRSLPKRLGKWTMLILRRQGTTPLLSETCLMTFFGLKVALSLMWVTAIEDMWTSEMFARLSDFQTAMSRDMYKWIRSALRFFTNCEHDFAVQDPFWHYRIMRVRFTRSTVIATAKRAMRFKKNIILFKSSSSAWSSVRDKPINFSIRFYANFCWTSTYLHSVY